MPDSTRPSRNTKNDALEALRGLAALVVFLGHILSMMDVEHRWLAPLQPVLNWGTEAVILFFVLSGIVIRLSEERRQRAPAEFAIDRLVRIYPLYIIALLLACAACRVLAQEIAPTTVIGNLAFVQSLQGYIAPTLPTDPPFWSLSFEMTFYASFALVLANRRVLKLWWTLAILSLCSYAIVLPGVSSTTRSWTLAAAWASHFRMIFAFSVIWLLGYALTRHRDRFRIDRGSALAVLPLAFAWARIKFYPDFYDPFRLLGFGAFLLPLFSSIVSRSSREIRLGLTVRAPLCALVLALLWTHSDSLHATKLALSAFSIAACLLAPSLATRLRVPGFTMRALVYLGSISYALYVVHYPIVLVTTREVRNPVVAIVVVVATVIALSHLLERGLQPRIARAVRRLRTGAPPAADVATAPG